MTDKKSYFVLLLFFLLIEFIGLYYPIMVNANDKYYNQLTQDMRMSDEIMSLDVTDNDEKRDQLIVLGASYAMGWHLKEIAGMSVINKGINGEQSYEMLARFEKDVVSLKPKAVIIWGFINDIFRGQRENMESIKSRIQYSFIEMIEHAKANDIDPILSTEVTIRGPDTWSEKIGNIFGWIMNKESYQEYINRQVLETNEWIKEFAADNRLLVLDIQPVLAEKSGMRKKEYAASDGSHISSEGYETISKYAVQVLENYFKSK